VTRRSRGGAASTGDPFRGDEPPISLFVVPKRETGRSRSKEKKCLAARISPCGEIWPKYGGVPNRPVRKPSGFIRLRCGLASGRAFMPHVDTLGADLDGGSGRAVRLFPLPLRWSLPVGWHRVLMGWVQALIGVPDVLPLRWQMNPVGADLRPKSRPLGGWPAKGGLRAALPTSARPINGGHFQIWYPQPMEGTPKASFFKGGGAAGGGDGGFHPPRRKLPKGNPQSRLRSTAPLQREPLAWISRVAYKHILPFHIHPWSA